MSGRPLPALPVYVNGERREVPPGATALDAVRAFDAAAAAAVSAGTRVVTDSRGLPVAADAPAYAGAIFRLVAARPRPGEPNVDAEPAAGP